ncbi:MAG: NADH-quinone oxidoreductase subunit NuoF [Chloroflexota bacterium]
MPGETPLTKNIRPDAEPLDLAAYERAGGYQGLRQALAQTPQGVQEVVKQSNLRGRGGAGFPTGVKWSVVPLGAAARQPKYLIANVDEMEPGAFKDRFLVEGDPHQLLEGMIIAAYAIEARQAYVFLRWAYKVAARRLQQAIDELYAAGYLGQNVLGSGWALDLHLHTGAGRYICGEETALINSLEGKRATPRSKPPFPQVSGFWGKPTIVNNAETLCNIPHILAKGADWFKSLAPGSDGGTKLYGISGKVKRPGLWELPIGTTVRELLEERAGGMREGLTCRGLIPGGASTDFLLPDQFDVKMDFDSVQKAGSRLGTGTLVVLDDQTCPVGFVLNLEQFFAQESCGWCTPCREGLPWVVRLLAALEAGSGTAADIAILREHTASLWIGKTFCALAPGAMEPLQSALKFFGQDFERHVGEQRCPWRA